MHFSVEKIKATKEADAWVMQHKKGSIHQTSAWFLFQETIPGRSDAVGYLCRNEGGEIMSVCWGMRMDTGHGAFWFYTPRGPVFSSAAAGKFLVNHIKIELKQHKKAIHWRLDPPATAAELADMGLGSLLKEVKSYHPTDSLIIDISQTEEEILSQMKRKGRYNIKVAAKKGISVVRTGGAKVTDLQVSEYIKLQDETTDRDRFRAHDADYYTSLFASLGKNAQLFEAFSSDGKVIAAAILTISGNEAIYYFGVSTSNSADRPLMAPYALQWAMMQYAKSVGCKKYDLTGIAPEGQENHAYARMTQFKTRFGGQRLSYSAGREIPIRPVLYWLYRLSHWLRNVVRSVI